MTQGGSLSLPRVVCVVCCRWLMSRRGVGVLIANTGNRLNRRVRVYTGGDGRGFIFASITRNCRGLSVAGLSTVHRGIGRGSVRIVIGYTTCAGISGTRDSFSLTGLLGGATTNGLTRTVGRISKALVRIDASCIFRNSGGVPYGRS